MLDQVHILIEERNIHFALTGSSSRKLKRGRADMQKALQWGTLPKVAFLSSTQDRNRFLRTYAQTYIKEEILEEQLVRNLDPFRLFQTSTRDDALTCSRISQGIAGIPSAA